MATLSVLRLYTKQNGHHFPLNLHSFRIAVAIQTSKILRGKMNEGNSWIEKDFFKMRTSSSDEIDQFFSGVGKMQINNSFPRKEQRWDFPGRLEIFRMVYPDASVSFLQFPVLWYFFFLSFIIIVHGSRTPDIERNGDISPPNINIAI
jgi:hypothetical protein